MNNTSEDALLGYFSVLFRDRLALNFVQIHRGKCTAPHPTCEGQGWLQSLCTGVSSFLEPLEVHIVSSPPIGAMAQMRLWA